MKMKIIVVGLGSMGRRRIRLLNSLEKEFEILGIDSNIERLQQSEDEFDIKTSSDLDISLKDFKPDCAIVCTSPLSHADIIEKCLLSNCHVFTEINLVTDKYDSNIEIAKNNNKVLFLSSTQIYKNEIKYIFNEVNSTSCKLNYNYHIGQYLPDWHPWESINNYFVGDKRTNGCREILAIELPWLVRTFGPIKDFKVLKSKMSNLNINYNDNYLILFEHLTGNKGVLSVDIVSRKAVRLFELYGENIYLYWDGTPSGLKKYDFINRIDKSIVFDNQIIKQEGYTSFITENAYLYELETFFDMIDNNTTALWDFKNDKEIINIIDNIELGVK